MYKTKTDMTKSDFYIKHSTCRQYLDDVYKQFSKLLTKNKYHGYYFDRSDSNCLCDNTGTFTCQGAWNQTSCYYERGTGHKINPYQNRESRIIFSTWNLDHWYSNILFDCLKLKYKIIIFNIYICILYTIF